jgi:branched-chain amino acid transport system substrate-binding protein
VGLFGAKRIAVLHDSAYYGTPAAKIIRKKIDEYKGISIVIEEQFDRTDTNMIPQLTRIKAAKPDLIILQCTGGAMAAIIAKNYKQLGITTRVVSSGSLSQRDFIKLGGGQIAEENGWMALLLKISVAEKISPDDPFRKTVYEPFKRAFQNKYGKQRDVNVFHAGPPDAINILVAALSLAGSDDRTQLRDALEKVRAEGMLGPFACSPTDHQGSPKDTSIWSEMKNGEWIPK